MAVYFSLCLCFRTSFLKIRMIYSTIKNVSHSHMNGLASRLVLEQRQINIKSLFFKSQYIGAAYFGFDSAEMILIIFFCSYCSI